MEFIEMMNQISKICNHYREKHNCENCPIDIESEDLWINCFSFIRNYPEKAEEIVTKWTKENVPKTHIRVITAPDNYELKRDDITCFLAGGITGCYDWQKKVLDHMEKLYEKGNSTTKEALDHLVIFNPRRENFPIDNPAAANEQIEWEFNRLNKCNIFSIYFPTSDSDQPICMYELGRYVNEKTWLHGTGKNSDLYKHLVITVEVGYKRKNDVVIQTNLATRIGTLVYAYISSEAAIESHASRIVQAAEALYSKEEV